VGAERNNILISREFSPRREIPKLFDNSPGPRHKGSVKNHRRLHWRNENGFITVRFPYSATVSLNFGFLIGVVVADYMLHWDVL